MMQEAHRTLHKLWTAAKDTTAYDKEDWKLLEGYIHTGGTFAELDRLKADVARLESEREQLYSYAQARAMMDRHAASQAWEMGNLRGALAEATAHVERLRGLVKQAPSRDMGNCSWCEGGETQHDDDCPAFDEKGQVR